jgi:hypothetical protein
VAIAAERARSLPEGDRLQEMTVGPVPDRRLKAGDGRYSSWQHCSDEVLRLAGIDPTRTTRHTLDTYMGVRRRVSGVQILMRDPRGPTWNQVGALECTGGGPEQNPYETRAV